MNKIKSRYSLRRFDLPESFNQSDVMIEVPFEYGMINIYPYYDTIEIIEYNSNGTEDEKEFYEDELAEAIHWDALAAAYDDF